MTYTILQVHSRPEYLQHLVNSLRSARDIEQTLLIFSHDIYSSELNSIVASIDFCPVSLPIHFVVDSSESWFSLSVVDEDYFDDAIGSPF